jgi:hypothetical protein
MGVSKIIGMGYSSVLGGLSSMPKALGSIPRIDFPQKLFQFKILAESYIF